MRYAVPTCRRSRRPRGALVLALAVASTAIAAQPDLATAAREPDRLIELPLEQLLDVPVYAASKYVQKSSDAPSAVSVVTAEDIKAFGYRNLADILKSIRGLYVSYDRNYSYIGARGFSRPGDYNTRVLLLIDGYRVNDNVYDQAVIGNEFPLDVDLIARVEFIPGPGSSIYGSNALFGVINIVTKSGRDYMGGEIKGEIASADTQRGRATFGKRWDGDKELLLSATGLHSGGRDLYFPEFDSLATNHGIAQGLDYERAQFVFGKFTASGVTAEVIHHERTKGVPTASFGQVFDDPRSNTVDGRTALSLSYYKTWSDYEASARVSYTDWAYSGDYILDYPPVTDNKDKARGRWWDTELKLVSSAWRNHRIVAGIEYQQDLEKTQLNYDLEPHVTYLDDHRAGYRYGLFAQDEVTLTSQLSVSGGLRYDYYSRGADALNPRLAGVYKPWETTSLKLLYGTAFRVPNAYELYYGQLDFQNNVSLKPEKITTYELVAEQRLGTGVRLTGSLFRYNITDLITLTRDPSTGTLSFTNEERAQVNGSELELEKLWSSGVRMRASVTWQRAIDTEGPDDGARLTNSPLWLAKLNLIAPLWHDVAQLGLESQYVGRRLTPSGGEVGGFTIFNVTMLSSRLAHGLEVSGSIYNLFNKRTADPASEEHVQSFIVQDGRTYRLSLSYRF
jgi:iron complex outermembrane receptor protein